MSRTFTSQACSHIDTVGTNILIRGPMPLVCPDIHFAYTEIEQAIDRDLSRMNFIEIPIIDSMIASVELACLLHVFGIDTNGGPGSLWPWWSTDYDPNQFHGTQFLPDLRGDYVAGHLIWRPFEGLPFGEDQETFLISPGWDYCGFIDNLIDLMSLLTDTAVYMHCLTGRDQVWAAHTGYLMQMYNISLTDAQDRASSSTQAGPPNEDCVRLVEAYTARLIEQ